jgi:hypothetical protein
MVLAALSIAAFASIGWCLWVRRLTWGSRWESAATLNVALQGIALLLMSNAASAAIGAPVHWVSGEWNVEDFTAHICYLVAAIAVADSVMSRLKDDASMQRSFRQWVELPCTLCIPVLLAFFMLGNGDRIYRANFLDVPADGWLCAYWIVLCGMLIYLLMYSWPGLLALCWDPPSRSVAIVCLLASAFGVAACASAALEAIGPQSYGRPQWALACMCAIGFALASAYSWRRKVGWFATA